jgi:hypothetical protein
MIQYERKHAEISIFISTYKFANGAIITRLIYEGKSTFSLGLGYCFL